MGVRPTGTVTFLFTDIEGSTRLWEERPDEMRAALVDHDAMLRSSIETHGGYVFATGGDGFAAAFQRAADAVDAAAKAQAGLADHPLIRARMGIHTGEVQERDGDYFGPAVNRTARIMAAGHGGQVVCSAATAELLRDRNDLKDLGEHRLRDLSRPERVWQIAGTTFPPLRSLEGVRTNFPVQVTSFVGRDDEIADLARLLAANPVITLCGVGGVGKTRLAQHAAIEHVDQVAGGAWLVELAPCRGDDDVVGALAAVWDVQPRGHASLLEAVLDAARARRSLVVLDNCEHVIDGAAELVDALVRRGATTVLATSREPLGVDGERVVRVRSLSDAASVQLFVDRATAARNEFAPTAAELGAIGSICARLDGVPLAIELAAARVRAMSVDDIATRLDQRFRLLTGGRRTAVERHQTLRAAVEWSYELLSPAERDALAQLSVFSGGFTLDAATHVLDESCDDDPADVVTALVDKSLVATHGGGAVRFTLLETIRQFAAEKLEQAGDADAVRRRHVRWMAAFVGDAARGLRGPQSPRWWAALEQELDNLRGAVDWCLDAGELDSIALLLSPLSPMFLYLFGAGTRVSSMAEMAARHVHHPEVQALAAWHAVHVGDLARAEEHLMRARDAPGSDHSSAQCNILYVETTLHLSSGRHDEAGAASMRRSEVAAARGDEYEQANALAGAITLWALVGKGSPTAIRRQSLHLARTLGEPALLALALSSEASALTIEQSPGVRAVAEEGLAFAQDPYVRSWLSALAVVHGASAAAAAPVVLDAIQTFEERAELRYQTYLLELATILLAHHDPSISDASVVWGFVAGSSPLFADQFDQRRIRHDPRFAEQRALGASLTLHEATAIAARALESLASSATA